ncbi:hypothetical protein ABZ079_35925 [Streptomyces sp. NPDC006314]|uniref:hypothetical protein n=1 Tax=Streptomyces sp. NPDC006314 TaxID=3154475 RepID=UPI0033BC75AF
MIAPFVSARDWSWVRTRCQVQQRAEGLQVKSSARALSEERREQLEDIDPLWCPTWPVEWQRDFHLL